MRERLQNEQKAINEVETSLQAELNKIGEEMSALRLQLPQAQTSPTRTPNGTDSRALAARLTALESKVSASTADLATRSTSIQRVLDSSLLVSEKKAKKLDELYREANAENEALYERFNEELGKVLQGVKGGQVVEELKNKLKEAQEEVGGLKRENWRLKRENIGLRSQIRGE